MYVCTAGMSTAPVVVAVPATACGLRIHKLTHTMPDTTNPAYDAKVTGTDFSYGAGADWSDSNSYNTIECNNSRTGARYGDKPMYR